MFNPDGEGGYWQKLPAEFGGVELRIAFETVPKSAPDWSFIEAFTEFVLTESHHLVSKSQLPLRFLAGQTGWFTEEAAAAVFAWQEVVLLYDVSDASKALPSSVTFEMHFTLELPGQAWVDAYGDWVVTYQGPALIGLRRNQV